MNLRRFLPLIILAVIAALLAAVYLPGYLRLFSFKHALGRFVHLIKDGKIIEAANYVVDDERERVLELIRNYVPPTYEKDIQTLRVHRIERDRDDYVVILVVRAEGTSYRVASKVRMRWRRVERIWQFPFSRIETAELLSEDWRSLAYLLNRE